MNLPFSIYISLPSSIFILIVGLIVWMRGRGKEQVLFLFLSIAQFVWSFGTFVFYEGYLIGKVNNSIFLDKALALSVFLIPVFIYNFTIEFCRCKVKSQRFILFASYAIAIFFVFVADIKTILNGVFFYKWGDMAYSEGIIHYLFLVFILALLSISLSNLFTTLKKDKSGFKDKLTYILLAIAIFGLVFIDFLPVYGVNIYPVFYLTIPVYALIMAYVLVEKNPLSSLITTDIMVAMVLTLLSSLIIFSDAGITLPERTAIFILISVFSYFILQRSHVLAEEKIVFAKELKARTQELEEQSEQLKKAKATLEQSNAILEEGSKKERENCRN